jgi:hypothetical protein
MKVLGVLFIFLQALAALAMLALSVHAPSGLASAAPVYLAVAATLTAFAAYRVKSTPLTLGVGLLMLALAPGIYLALDLLENIVYERRLAATAVSDVRDEPILSAAGRPIGVRLSFAVVLPNAGYFGISPSLDSPGAATERLRLDPMKRTIDGRLESVRFEPGRRHELVIELYPPILFIKPQGERCLTSVAAPTLPEPSVAKPLRIMIYETSYGLPWRGGREESTRGAYDLAAMYRGVLAEGLKPCTVGQ